jgi:hypothetical protein
MSWSGAEPFGWAFRLASSGICPENLAPSAMLPSRPSFARGLGKEKARAYLRRPSEAISALYRAGFFRFK